MTNDNRALKRVSLEFRDVASAALRSDNNSARRNLRRLLAFVETTPLLKATVDSAPTPELDVAETWDKAAEMGESYPYPDDELEELAHTHRLLQHFSKESGKEFWAMCYGYQGRRSGGIDSAVSDVLHEVAGKYINFLNRVLELALLESADDRYSPARQIQVSVSGGMPQINLAQDQSVLVAQQSHGLQVKEIVEGASTLAQLLAQQNGHEALEAQEAARAIVKEVSAPKPEPFTLKSATKHLELYARSTAALGTIAAHVDKLVPLVRQFIDGLSK